MSVTSRSFRQYLPRKTWQLLLLGATGLFAAGVVILALLALILLPTLPSIEDLPELNVPMRVYTADGTLIAEFGEEKRIPVKTENVPQPLINAILAAEDDSFYSHHGVDFLGIVRAVLANIRSGQRRQGASTITMQVARNFFLSPERTYTRKFKEVLLAFKLERELSKDQILELYLNKIFLGHRSYGFAAASQVYYGKLLSELTLSQYAMLAGLPKAPSKFNPITNPERAKIRRDYVLNRMLKLKYIDEETLNAALEEPVTASKHIVKYAVDAPYVAEIVRQYVLKKYREQAYSGGLHIYTTIDAKHQFAANVAVRSGLMEYDQRHGYRGPVGRIKLTRNTEPELLDDTLREYPIIGNLIPAIVMEVKDKALVAYTQDGETVEIEWEGLSWARRYKSENLIGRKPKRAADIARTGDVIYTHATEDGKWLLAQAPAVSGALITIRPSDGAILGLVGGYDFYQNKFNHATQAYRQPGSNIKPFIYSAALANGYTAATNVSGAPIVVEDTKLDFDWRPENYNKKWPGPTPLRKALRRSINTVAIRLVRALKPRLVVEHLERFGFARDRLPMNWSLALGSPSLTPIDMVTGFAVFANGGYKTVPYLVLRIEDSKHKIIEEANPLVVCPTCPEAKLITTKEGDKKQETEKKPEEKPVTDKATTTESDKEATESDKDTAETEYVKPEPRYAQRVISEENAYIMTTIMRDVINSGTAIRARTMGLKRKDIAGKTGTTNDYRDAWFSGFNADIVTTVWVGFDTPTSLGRGEAGSRAALPIWVRYIEVVLDKVPEKELKRPANIIVVTINKETGKLTTEDDPDAIEEYFIKGTEPTATDEATSDEPIDKKDGTDTADSDEMETETKKKPRKPKSAEDIF